MRNTPVLLLAAVLSASGAFAEQKLAARDGSSLDRLGYSVAISGDTLVAGSIMDSIGPNAEQGSATVFTRNANVWTEQATLMAADAASYDTFGHSVAIDGDTIAVGAFKDSIGESLLQGSVYIFVRNGGTWTQQAKVVSHGGEENDVFGYSVALNGDTLVVGAPGRDNDFAAYGAAYVFRRTGSTWTQQAMLQPTGGWTSDNFGLAVAVDGETVVVSTGRHDLGAHQNQGAAWVYTRSGNIWTEKAKLTASDAAIFDEFGCSVDIDGDTIIVGSFARIGANDYQGAAYIFERSGGVWREETKLIALDGEVNDRFGFSVALEGDTAVVGAIGDDIDDRQNQGSISIFTRGEGGWLFFAKRTESDGDPFDNVGYSVGIGGNDIAAGIPGDNLSQGSVYVFGASALPHKRRAARK